MSELISKFIEFMDAHGCGPENISDVLADDVRRDYRLAGDRAGVKKGRYRLKIEGDRGVGWCVNYRDGELNSWSSGSKKAWTAEEKAAWKSEIEAKKEADRIEREAEFEARAVDAQACFDAAELLPEGSNAHPYLTRKKVRAYGGLRVGIDTYGRTDCLLIPMRDRVGKLWNIQSIAPDGDKMIGRGRAHGLFHVIGRVKDIAVMVEGYATGATISAALAVGAIVGFSTGNLMPVARDWHDAGTRLVFCADNDQWVLKSPRPADLRGLDKNTVAGDDLRWQEWRGAGLLVNPGMDAAQAAAKAVDGFVIWPDFPADDAAKNTDFNDLRVKSGINAVITRIMPVLERARNAAATEGRPLVGPDSVQRSGSAGGDAPPAPASAPYNDAPLHDDMAGMVMDQNDVDGDGGLPFFTLGFDNGVYYYYPIRTMQIVSLTPGGHSINNLLQLGSLADWQDNPMFSRLRPTEIAIFAANWMMNRAHEIGVFKPDERIRGRGIWIDDGRVVYHAGNILYVDGVRTPIIEFKSWYVYVQSYRMTEPGTEVLSNPEANKLRQICESFTWEKKLSGSLMAGWIVVSFMSALLKWRPHIWVTGESGSGKTTCKNLVYDILGDVAFKFDGMSTEPAMRTKMRRDALPVLIDEMEAETPAQKVRVAAILELCRNASSGATVEKFGQDAFAARFCAGMFSINPPVKETADKRRISMMVLKTNKAPDADEHYQKLCDFISETITPQWRVMMINRIVKNTDTILQNIKTFNTAARKILKNAGAADQISPMLAGLYFLSTTDEISLEKAEEFICQHDWDDHTTIAETSDPQKLLYRISSSTIKYEPASGSGRDVSIGELIVAAAGRDAEGTIDKKLADKKLRQYGIKVKVPSVLVANRNQNLGKLLRDTPWSTGEEGWGRTLGDLIGATKPKDPTSFASGTPNQKYVSVPLSYFINDDTPPVQASMDMDEEIPF